MRVASVASLNNGWCLPRKNAFANAEEACSAFPGRGGPHKFAAPGNRFLDADASTARQLAGAKHGRRAADAA
eukprot:6502100-Lingulodinium_polyedra.AAC.1